VPKIGISTAVDDGKDGDQLGFHSVEDKIWKLPDYCPTEISKDSGVQLWIGCEPV